MTIATTSHHKSNGEMRRFASKMETPRPPPLLLPLLTHDYPIAMEVFLDVFATFLQDSRLIGLEFAEIAAAADSMGAIWRGDFKDDGKQACFQGCEKSRKYLRAAIWHLIDGSGS